MSFWVVDRSSLLYSWNWHCKNNRLENIQLPNRLETSRQPLTTSASSLYLYLGAHTVPPPQETLQMSHCDQSVQLPWANSSNWAANEVIQTFGKLSNLVATEMCMCTLVKQSIIRITSAWQCQQEDSEKSDTIDSKQMEGCSQRSSSCSSAPERDNGEGCTSLTQNNAKPKRNMLCWYSQSSHSSQHVNCGNGWGCFSGCLLL